MTNAAFTDPSDQSPWFYQRWLLGRQTPKLEITNVYATTKCVCVAFSQSVSPSSVNIAVRAYGDEPWQTVDGEISSYIWVSFYTY